MDIKKKHWFSSSSSQATQAIRLGRSYTHCRSHSPPGKSSYNGTTTTTTTTITRRTKPVWHVIWRKLKRDEKKVFSSAPAVEGIFNYDPETYSMNFDQGTGWMEPDNLSRSFSARYADPSRILPPKHLLDC